MAGDDRAAADLAQDRDPAPADPGLRRSGEADTLKTSDEEPDRPLLSADEWQKRIMRLGLNCGCRHLFYNLSMLPSAQREQEAHERMMIERKCHLLSASGPERGNGQIVCFCEGCERA